MLVAGLLCASGHALAGEEQAVVNQQFRRALRDGKAIASDGSSINGLIVEWMGDSISSEAQAGIARAAAFRLGCNRIKGYMTGGGPGFDDGISGLPAAPDPSRVWTTSDWSVANHAWYWMDTLSPHEMIPSSMGPQSVSRCRWISNDPGGTLVCRWAIVPSWIASHISPAAAAEWNGACRARVVLWSTPNSVTKMQIRTLRAGTPVATSTIDCSSASPGIKWFEIAIPAGAGDPGVDLFPAPGYDETGRELIVEGATIWIDDANPGTTNLFWNRGGTTSQQLDDPAYLDPSVHRAWRDAYGGVDAVALWIGTNDSRDNYANNATHVMHVAQRAHDDIAARARRPLLLFIAPYQDIYSSDAGLNIVRASLGGAATTFQGAFVDLWARTGPYVQIQNYLYDGVHPSSAGGEYFTSVIAQGLNLATCPANCDGTTVAPLLSANDFICFLNHFRAGDIEANCDGSTTPPILTGADFICFLNAFRRGCSPEPNIYDASGSSPLSR
jgi:hypothetical protein